MEENQSSSTHYLSNTTKFKTNKKQPHSNNRPSALGIITLLPVDYRDSN